MAAGIKDRLLNVIGWETGRVDPRDYRDYDEEEYDNEEESNLRRNYNRSSVREEREPAGDSRRYSGSYDDSRGYEREEPQEDYRERSSYQSSLRSNSKIINHPAAAAAGYRMRIYQPSGYEDARNVIDDLLDGDSVLINLETLDLAESQRIIDTLIGACYAIDATIKRAAASTYLLAPGSIEISGAYAEAPQGRRAYD
ncbi:MAG: cell division protein SepF [Christensenellaceae bacterium]|jgi:cell division inhibitor SepF|nr:cell division protein SepF [Christensenellaceae bacterium]